MAVASSIRCSNLVPRQDSNLRSRLRRPPTRSGEPVPLTLADEAAGSIAALVVPHMFRIKVYVWAVLLVECATAQKGAHGSSPGVRLGMVLPPIGRGSPPLRTRRERLPRRLRLPVRGRRA